VRLQLVLVTKNAASVSKIRRTRQA